MMHNLARQDKILDLVRSRRELAVAELARTLEVSDATVRRDLEAMERRGLLRRVHGGATLAGISRLEPLFSDKEGQHTAAKQAIAQAALNLIEDGEQIYLDGGSTVLMLARLLDRKRDLTIVTNSFMAAACLLDTTHRLILSGGEFRSLSRTMVGPLTAPILNELHVDKAFMGTIGFAVPDGMTTTDPNEAFTKEQVMRRARRVILLADSSKFGVNSFARSGSLEDIDTIVTERIEPADLEACRQHGITVLTAEAASVTA